MGDRWQAVLSHTPATYTACRPVDSRWHPVIQQVGYPAPLFDHIVHARVQQAAALLPQATRVSNAMIVHGSMISNRDKDDVREPLRYALDIHKFEKQAKREANDSRGIIPLPRGLAGIPQHNHNLTGSNNRRAGVITQKDRDKIDKQLARVGAPPINWDLASRVSWFKSRKQKASKAPRNPHRPRKFDVSSPYSAYPNVPGRYIILRHDDVQPLTHLHLS